MAEEDVSGASQSQGSSTPADGVGSLRSKMSAQQNAYRKAAQERREKRRAGIREELLDQGVPEDTLEEEIDRVLKKERDAKENSAQTEKELLAFRDEYDDEDLKKLEKNRTTILRDSQPVLDALRKQGNNVMVEEFFPFVKPRVFNDLVEGHTQRLATATDEIQRAKVASDTLESILSEAQRNGSGPTREIRRDLNRSVEVIARRVSKGEARSKAAQPIIKKPSKIQAAPPTGAPPPPAVGSSPLPDEEPEKDLAKEDDQTVRETREQLRTKRLQAKAASLKDDPEAELFVRLVAAGIPFESKVFQEIAQRVQTPAPGAPPISQEEALAVAAVAYLGEKEALTSNPLWRGYVRQAAATTADSPSHDPVYRAIVEQGRLLPEGAPHGLQLPPSREERLKFFVRQFPEKSKTYAFSNTEIATALQTVGSERGSGSTTITQTFEADLALPTGGAGVAGAVAAGLAGAAVALGAEALGRRRQVLLANNQAIAGAADALRVQLGKSTRPTEFFHRRVTSFDTMQDAVLSEVSQLKGDKVSPQQFEVILQNKTQEFKSHLSDLHAERQRVLEQEQRELRDGRKNPDHQRRVKELDREIQQTNIQLDKNKWDKMKHAMWKETGYADKRDIMQAFREQLDEQKGSYTVPAVPDQARATARRLSARRLVGRNALAAGAFGAAASLIGGQQSSRLATEGLGGEQDAYSSAFGSGQTRRRSVIDSPGVSYTIPEDGEGRDVLISGAEQQQAIREKERGMREAVEFQLGEEEEEAPVGEVIVPGEQPTEKAPPSDERETDDQEQEAEADRVRQLLFDQQRAQELEAAAQEQASGEGTSTIEGAKRLSDFAKMTKYGSSATGIGIAWTIAMMNYHMVMKLFGVKKQSFIEDIATICLDVAIIGTGLMMMVPLLLGIAALIGVSSGIGAGVSAVTDFFGF